MLQTLPQRSSININGAKLRILLDRYGVTFLTLLLCGVLILLITKWTWLFLKPVEQKAPIPSAMKLNMNALTDQIADAHIFGTAGQDKPLAAEQISTLNLHLKGVFAFDPSTPAFAIINTGNKDEAFKVGDQIMTGVKLHEVQPRHIVIDRSGSLEKVLLEEKQNNNSAGVMPPPSLPPAIQPPQPAPSPIDPSSQPAYNLSHQEIASAMQNRNRSINQGKIAPSAAGGIKIEDIPSGSIAEKLGLQSGDIIRSINGSAINSPFDLARLYQQLAPGSQIQVEGMRGAKPINLSYQVR